MQAVNTQTLVHVGVELVVISGVTFWVHRKTSLLQEEINDLRDKVAKADDLIERQGQLLARHDQIIRQMLNGGGPNPSLGGNSVQSMQPRRGPSQSPMSEQSRRPPRASNSDLQQSQSYQHDEEPDMPDEQLDELLQTELGNLEESRGKTPEFIELDCTGDSCTLKAPKDSSRAKKKNRGKGSKIQ